MENSTNPVQINSVTSQNSAVLNTIYSETSNKTLIIAVAVVIVAVGFGIFALLSHNSSSKYQGMIQKIEEQTVELQEANEKLVR